MFSLSIVHADNKEVSPTQKQAILKAIQHSGQKAAIPLGKGLYFFTKESLRFHAALGLLAAYDLAFHYEKNPRILEDTIHTATDPLAQTGLAAFIAANVVTANALSHVFTGSISRSFIPYFSMSAGTVASTLLVEAMMDEELKECAKGLFKEKNTREERAAYQNICDRAQVSWNLKTKTEQLTPLLSSLAITTTIMGASKAAIVNTPILGTLVKVSSLHPFSRVTLSIIEMATFLKVEEKVFPHVEMYIDGRRSLKKLISNEILIDKQMEHLDSINWSKEGCKNDRGNFSLCHDHLKRLLLLRRTESVKWVQLNMKSYSAQYNNWVRTLNSFVDKKKAYEDFFSFIQSQNDDVQRFKKEFNSKYSHIKYPRMINGVAISSFFHYNLYKSFCSPNLQNKSYKANSSKKGFSFDFNYIRLFLGEKNKRLCKYSSYTNYYYYKRTGQLTKKVNFQGTPFFTDKSGDSWKSVNEFRLWSEMNTLSPIAKSQWEDIVEKRFNETLESFKSNYKLHIHKKLTDSIFTQEVAEILNRTFFHSPVLHELQNIEYYLKFLDKVPNIDQVLFQNGRIIYAAVSQFKEELKEIVQKKNLSEFLVYSKTLERRKTTFLGLVSVLQAEQKGRTDLNAQSAAIIQTVLKNLASSIVSIKIYIDTVKIGEKKMKIDSRNNIRSITKTGDSYESD